MKTKLRIMNFIYFVISSVAIVWYAITPFFKASISADVTAETLKTFVDDSQLEEFGITVDDLFSEQNSIKLDLAVEIDNKTLIDVWSVEDGKEFVTNSVITPNINAVIEDLEPVLNTVVKTAAKGMLTNIVEDELKNILGEGEDLYAKLGESGLSQEDVKESVNKIMDVVLSDEPQTLDSVADVLAEEYNVYAEALGGPDMTAEEFKENMQSTFEEFGLIDENGNITDINEAIAALLGGLLGGESGETPAPQTTIRRMFNPMFEEPKEGSEENPLTAKLVEVINSKLTDEVKEYIVLGLKGAGIAVVAFMFVWAIKVLQCIFSLFAKKPYIRKELFGILLGFVQLLLGLISLIFILISKVDLTPVQSVPFVGEIVKMIPQGLSISMMFSATIPAALLIVNFLYSGIYSIAKRKFKRAYRKGEID
ncbi:MAG: hypothetical protein MJZ37_03670 [Bacilli bacterium]|nr:hypothetical protein [Bacilli bacterium]